MPTCATSIWESTLLAASLPRFRFFISSKLISWLVNSDCIFCWKTKTAISNVWRKYCMLFQFFGPVDFGTHWAAAPVRTALYSTREVALTLCSVLCLECSVQLWASQSKRNTELLEGPQCSLTKMIKDEWGFFFFKGKQPFSLVRTLKINHRGKMEKLIASLFLVLLIFTVSPGKLRQNWLKYPASITSSSP